MKTKYLKGMMAVGFAAMLLFSSCLKDDAHYFDPESTVSNVAELPLSGLNNFSADAITKSGIDTITFAVGVTAANPPTSPTVITIGVDNTVVTSYNAANTAIVYQTIPAAAFKLPATTITIPAGQNSTLATVIIDRTQLDPAGSYMLPVRITNAGGITISGNYSIHYYHIIGNDFAGAYIWDYRRYNNGLAGGTSAGTLLGQAGTISPISPTEFQMITGYNGEKVAYDVTFTRTVTNGVVTYSNWKVTFPASEIAKWTADGITNMVPPAFTIPPPTNATDPKIIEINYVSGGASPRYIDDTYTKK